VLVSTSMSASVPIIFTPSIESQRLSIGARMMLLGLSLASLGVLILAHHLTPSPRGIGTHQQMGFQSCEFLQRTHLPCPTCGMTTSFSYFARGNWIASFYIQPMGFLLALACAGVFWGSLHMALTGAPLHRLLRQVRMVRCIVILMGFAIAAWGWKILIHLNGWDGWR
jgi:hypothetical protein